MKVCNMVATVPILDSTHASLAISNAACLVHQSYWGLLSGKHWFVLQAELLTGEPLFPGSSDIDQVHQQLQLLGPLPATMTRSFASNPHNAQATPLPARPTANLKVW